MQRILSVFIFAVIISTSNFAQTGIDYFPKSLKLQLSKKNSSIAEIKLAPELVRSLHSGKFFICAGQKADSLLKYVYVGRVNTCRVGGCSIYQNSNEESEFFDYFILFDKVGTVQNIKIFNYQATHGQEITSGGWLKQFRNYDGKKELIVGKNVDAISGATISVNAATFDIEHKTKILNSLIK